MMLTKVCWVFVCPAILLTILFVSLYLWKDPLYGGDDGVRVVTSDCCMTLPLQVPYPQWAHWVGWGLVGASAGQVPLWAAVMFLFYLCRRRVKQVVAPTPLWGPGDSQVSQHTLLPGRVDIM